MRQQNIAVHITYGNKPNLRIEVHHVTENPIEIQL
jgi:hypothetical protein